MTRRNVTDFSRALRDAALPANSGAPSFERLSSLPAGLSQGKADILHYPPATFTSALPADARQFILRWNSDGTPREPAPFLVWVRPLRDRTSADVPCTRCGTSQGVYDVVPDSIPEPVRAKLRPNRPTLVCPCRGSLLD